MTRGLPVLATYSYLVGMLKGCYISMEGTRRWYLVSQKCMIYETVGGWSSGRSPPPPRIKVCKVPPPHPPLLPAGLWPTFRSTFAWNHRIVRSFTLLISQRPLLQAALIESQLDQWCSILFVLAVSGNVESWDPFSASGSDIPTICTKPRCFPWL